MEKIKVSVIVPVYNAEKTIEKAVCSVISQNFDGLEILLIDDGSKDNSFSICKNLEEKYPCIKVISKENGGVSSVRNLGILKAQGEYIVFLDSDDEFLPNSLTARYSSAAESGADLVIAGYKRLDCGNEDIVKFSAEIDNYKDILNIVARSNSTLVSNIWNKLYRRDFITYSGVLFDEKRFHGEDWDFNIRLLMQKPKIKIIEDLVYLYNYVDGGWAKYRKNIEYSLIEGNKLSLKLIKKFADKKEKKELKIKTNGRFLDTIIKRINEIYKNEESAEKLIKNFIKNNQVKLVLFSILFYGKKSLKISDLSNIDKKKCLNLLFGNYKKVIRL